MHFKYEMMPSKDTVPPFNWFVYRKNDLLVQIAGNSATLPQVTDISTLNLESIRTRYFGLLEGNPCYFVEVHPDSNQPENMAFLSLRRLYGSLTEELLWIAGRGFQLMNWDRQTQYCGQCGTQTELNLKERAKSCPKCDHINFPRISPAVIVGVLKDNQILLANGTRFLSNIFSVLAGFVEPGESLEECVRREVKEEVGIDVKNVRYFGSQAWPFPDSLMIGFLANHAKGTIIIDQAEINEAGWFTADKLPNIPGKISIARKIIDWFVENS
ncbi:MAG: NAD(+) diphosphatase [Candidatus Hodarchaeales archaeon]|jgi:NAD+ diphosphatase